jgi:phosphoglycolate phosphatase
MDILFDLDGTLTDPETGITRCIEHALTMLGRAAPPRDHLRKYIGPPLRDSFVELLGPDGDPDAALLHYRDRFATVGLYENAVYPEVAAGLGRIRDRGHRLFVATSKPAVYARLIVDHFGLTPFFAGVYGSELTGEHADKAELVAHVIASERLDAPQVWMVGDRLHDIRGGRANGTRTIGVLWGYGGEEELLAAGADFLADSIAAVASIIDPAI